MLAFVLGTASLCAAVTPDQLIAEAEARKLEAEKALAAWRQKQLVERGELAAEVQAGYDVLAEARRAADEAKNELARTSRRLERARRTATADTRRAAAMIAQAADVADITVLPEALGAGVPLFTGAFAGPIQLVESIPYSNGAIRLVYELSQSTE